MNEPTHHSEAFELILEIADALKISHLSARGEPWVCKVDDDWAFGIHGENKPTQIEFTHGLKLMTEPAHAAITFGGMPGGFINPFGGVLFVSEDAFIDALRARILKETGNPAKTPDSRTQT